MEAKETRMDELRLWSILEDEKEKKNRSIILALKQVRNEQAEISFKAGYEQSVLDNDEWCHDGILKGRREVVEWLKEENDKNPQVLDGSYIIAKMNADRWQTKLKEWGI